MKSMEIIDTGKRLLVTQLIVILNKSLLMPNYKRVYMFMIIFTELSSTKCSRHWHGTLSSFMFLLAFLMPFVTFTGRIMLLFVRYTHSRDLCCGQQHLSILALLSC